MAYACPRCGKPVKRGENKVAGFTGGLAGALLAAAFGSFQCAGCGKIPTKEFPAEVRSKARLGSLAMVIGALLLIVFVFWLMSVM
jgi:hypothetical protein